MTKLRAKVIYPFQANRRESLIAWWAILALVVTVVVATALTIWQATRRQASNPSTNSPQGFKGSSGRAYYIDPDQVWDWDIPDSWKHGFWLMIYFYNLANLQADLDKAFNPIPATETNPDRGNTTGTIKVDRRPELLILPWLILTFLVVNVVLQIVKEAINPSNPQTD